MKIKSSFFLLLTIVLLGCSSQRKVDPKKVYTTDYGFTFIVPFEGNWFQGRADFYLFGTKAEKDGTANLAEVKHGFIYPKKKNKDKKIKVDRKTLQEVFGPGFETKTLEGTIEIKRSHVDYKTAKGTECMFFSQVGVNIETEFNMTYSGMICLLPDDGNKYVWMSVSQHAPKGKAFKNMKDEQIAFFNGLQFKKD